MTLFTYLRAIAWLKRLALAAERIARAQESLASLAEQSSPVRRRPQPVEFSLMDLNEIEKRIEQERIARGAE